ncbi:alanine racemase [Pilibacter termitis]|uniref:Alanine racemase n=1 Tax=Pilibacter termitis TaxID=263852 RepID=A0A1T4P8R6_9ENTE|nr:alanine racemase [Pilibacter termitis]SJZ87646.1 alanine racemase [Pilibacter termitis]
MIPSRHRPTQAIISEKAISHNIQTEVRKLDEKTELFAVVKANAYGHGAIRVAEIALNAGATGFCVATLDEALELRENGFTEQVILVLAPIPVEYLSLASQHDISLTIASLEWWEKAKKIECFQSVRLHIKIDTGMGRIGFRQMEEVLKAVEEIEKHPLFEWEGIFTHFATADSKNDNYYQMQSERFSKVMTHLKQKPRYIHVSNTASAFWHEEHFGNMIRFGVGIYGLNPSGTEIEDSYPLLPALRLESELIHVKLLNSGESIGYGSTYTTKEKEWIGTVPIGYADGWVRGLQGFHVLVDGVKCEIVGRICMDQLMIRLPESKKIGTKVTLVGRNGDEEITLQEVADYLGTIHYEVACQISCRVPRDYE